MNSKPKIDPPTTPIVEPKDNTDGRRRPAEAGQAQLTIIRGAQIGLVYYLNSNQYVFGRREEYLINDPLASRRHMQITYKGVEYILSDLDSTNGTYLNGSLVTQPFPLKHGDIIRVGGTILTFDKSDQESAVLGYGASPNNFADHRRREATIQTQFFNQHLSD